MSERPSKWRFRLFIGSRSKGYLAEDNLRHLCDESVPGEYTIEVIDITKNPELAREDQIMALPTLIRSQPTPRRKIIGDLSNRDVARAALDLPQTKRPATKTK